MNTNKGDRIKNLIIFALMKIYKPKNISIPNKLKARSTVSVCATVWEVTHAEVV